MSLLGGCGPVRLCRRPGRGPRSGRRGCRGVAVGDFASFGELVFIGVEFVEGFAVEVDVEGDLCHPLL